LKDSTRLSYPQTKNCPIRWRNIAIELMTRITAMFPDDAAIARKAASSGCFTGISSHIQVGSGVEQLCALDRRPGATRVPECHTPGADGRSKPFVQGISSFAKHRSRKKAPYSAE
jgi:hypothetical protein